MKRQVRSLADDIALGLAQRLRSQRAVAEPPRPKFFDLLVEEVTQEVVNALAARDLVPEPVEDRRALRLREVDHNLEDLASRIRSAIQEEIINDSSGLDSGPGSDSDPDSDEEGSKYRNIESLIKYVESSDGEGGVKLVIMNFND